MRRSAIRFVLILATYLVGERLLAATLRQGEDMGLGFWSVIEDTFDYHFYSLVRIALMLAVSMSVIAADFLTPKKMASAGLIAIGGFSGAYFYAMFFGYDYFADIDLVVGRFLERLLPHFLAEPFGVVFAICALTLPLVLLVILKTSIPGLRDDRSEPHGSNAGSPRA